MPTAGGPKDAVAVPSKAGDELLAAYSFMLSHIVLLIWWIAMIIALYISTRRHKPEHPNSKLHTKIWHKRSSPSRIVKFAFQRFLWPQPKSKSKSESESDPDHTPGRWFILLWLLIGISFLVVKYFIPIYFARFIKLGNAAPVSPDVIYVPSNQAVFVNPATQSSVRTSLQVNELFAAPAFRAVGAISTANDSFEGKPPVNFALQILSTDADGEVHMRIDYSYNVTGLDLGLQHYSDLISIISGSCVTNYSAWIGSTTDDPTSPGTYFDVYDIYGSNSTVSKNDGGPGAQFYADPSNDYDSFNISWNILISTVGRTSFTNSTDPWYRTGPNPIADDPNDPNTAFYGPSIVLPKRPVLSCWENNVWSYKGQISTFDNLGAPAQIPLPSGLPPILDDFIGPSMIFSLGSRLGQSALLSSTTSIGDLIDASTSSITADFNRLLFAAYIATTNIFTDSTLFPNTPTRPDNDAFTNGILSPGSSDFVIFSNGVEALSVKALIIIPTVTVGLWSILILILYLPRIKDLITSFKDKSSALAAATKDLEHGAEKEVDGLEDVAEGAGGRQDDGGGDDDDDGIDG
jgi:hypothetical protein